ncbi:MAG TPA: hypothetical protein VH352_27460, partial [Pseudonocardiaceae bacterium]|nr:hypothetical protein [Pseudonocardiaceae bacterium]
MTGAGTHIHVGGDVRGQIVVGDHNVTVWAEQSVVTVVQPGERPQPRRRADIALLPRRGVAPIGREHEIDAIRAAIATDRLAQVYGSPGSGKSTLARHVCADLTDGAGNGVVFLPAAQRDVTDVLQDVFETCYDAEGYRPGPVELRRLMSDVDIRLVIDDLDVEPEQRDVLLDGVPAATVFFTSAHRSVGVRALALPGLSAEAGLALLADGLGRPLRTEERSTGMELWRATAGSPLMLLRAAAAARPEPGGPDVASLPRPAELADLLPRLVAGLTGPALDCASVLALAGSAAVSAALLPWLFADVAMAVPAIDELSTLGLALQTETGYQLAPGVDTVVRGGREPDPILVARLATRLRDWAGVPGLRPADVADNAPFISTVIDAAVATGNAGLGATLAKAVAPMVACSLRLGAWGRILHRGKVAAEQAGDRSILAYLTHEDGILGLITGKRVAAVAAVGAAIAIWHELGDTAHLAAAHHTQALAGSAGGHVGTPGAVHAAGQVTGHHGAAAAVHTAGTKTAAAKAVTAGAKTGFGVAAKLSVAAVVTAAAVGGGGYLAVHTLTNHQTTTATTATTTRPNAPADPAAAYCASRNQSAPAIAYTTPSSVVLRCSTGNPVTLGTLSPSERAPGPVWSWDGSAVAWMTSNRLDVFRLGTAKLSSWDCANCVDLAFIGEQAVTVDASSSLPAGVPRLFVFPA